MGMRLVVLLGAVHAICTAVVCCEGVVGLGENYTVAELEKWLEQQSQLASASPSSSGVVGPSISGLTSDELWDLMLGPVDRPRSVTEINAVHLEANATLREMIHYGDVAVKPQDGAGPDGAVRGASCKDCGRWPKRADGFYEVPYVISAFYSAEDKREIIEWGMRYIEWHTNVRFVEKAAEHQNWIDIQHTGNGCYSYIGLIDEGGQALSLDFPGCTHHSTAIHELMHALGDGHEHQRPDRDQYLDVYLWNVQPGYANQLVKMPSLSTSITSYDYASVMHYGTKTFSKDNRATMEAKNRSYDKIVDAEGLPTSCDWKEINTIYPGKMLPPHCDPAKVTNLCEPLDACLKVLSKSDCQEWCTMHCDDIPNYCKSPTYNELLEMIKKDSGGPTASPTPTTTSPTPTATSPTPTTTSPTPTTTSAGYKPHGTSLLALASLLAPTLLVAL